MRYYYRFHIEAWYEKQNMDCVHLFGNFHRLLADQKALSLSPHPLRLADEAACSPPRMTSQAS
jgi:hypothetical protein